METDSTTVQRAGKPWGALATLLFGILVLIITNIAAFVLFYWLFAHADTLPLELPPVDEITESNGLILAVSTIFTTPIVLLLLTLLIQLRKGISFRDYMGCHTLALSKLFQWCGILLLFLIVTEILGMVVGRPAIPEFMTEAYRSANSLVLLFVALVIAAPLTEEFLFRGFLLTGFSRSRIGWLGAIIICSLFWSVIHLQYDWYDITWIFLLGLILGYAKKDSKTIYLPLIMHALVNTMAFVGTMSYLNGQQDDIQAVGTPYYSQRQATDYSNADHYLQLLHDGDYQKLDQLLQQLQKNYRAGTVDEYQLVTLFGVLNRPSPDNLEHFDHWTEQLPESHIGYLLRGIYYNKKAWKYRGDKYANETPKENFVSMREYLAKAATDLNKSLTILPEQNLAYKKLLDMSKSFSLDQTAEAVLEKALLYNPSSLDIRKAYLIGLTPKWGGSYAKIKAFLKQTEPYLEQFPQLTSLLGYVDFTRAENARYSSKLKQSLAYYDKAMEWGEASLYLYNRGIINYQLKHYPQTIEDFTKFLDYYPLSSKALWYRAKAHRNSDQFDSAFNDINFGLNYYPDNIDLLLLRAELSYQQKKHTEALEDYNKIIRLRPEKPHHWNMRGWHQLTNIKNYTAAIDDYVQAIELAPDNTDYRYNYALALYNKHDCKSAQALQDYLDICDTHVNNCPANKMSWAKEAIPHIEKTPECQV